MKDMVIFGANDFAKVMKRYFDRSEEYNIVGFIVDDEYLEGRSEFCGLPLNGRSMLDNLYPKEKYFLFIAIGYKDMNGLREQKIEEFKEKGYKFASYIDNTAVVDDSCSIADNCVIMENCVIGSYSIISTGTIVGPLSCICHDTVIGKYNYISAGVVILGFINIGDNCFVGGNATIIDHIKISPYTLIGASSYINKNTEPYSIYATKGAEDIISNYVNKKELQKKML